MTIRTASGKLTVKKLRGDRVRFKDFDRAQAYAEAYPDIDSQRVFTVLGREEVTGQPLRLRVDAPPFYVWPKDVDLCWNNQAERRTALLAAGHTER